MPAPYFPLVRAVDAAPAAQTAHWASVNKGNRRTIREKNILEIVFTLQIYKTFHSPLRPSLLVERGKVIFALPPSLFNREGMGMSIKIRNYNTEKSSNKPPPR
jgi:hypothetical protein